MEEGQICTQVSIAASKTYTEAVSPFGAPTSDPEALLSPVTTYNTEIVTVYLILKCVKQSVYMCVCMCVYVCVCLCAFWG